MKKFMYGMGYLLIFFVSLIAIKRHLSLFSLSEISLWNELRYVAFSGMLSAIIFLVACLILNRKQMLPFFQKFYKYKSLLYQLVKRDFKAKYKRSVLGVFWSVLNPLLTMIVLTIVFSNLFRFDIANFPVYLLSGQIIFTFFCEATNTCMFSVLSSAPLMKKVSMPKYIFPLSKAISSLVNFLFSIIALVIVMLVTKSPIHITLLASIVPILYMFIFATGIGLLLSTAVVYFRDMSYLYGIMITALTYLTPLFYPINIIPEQFRWLISINPLYHFVECFRTTAIYGGVPTAWQNLICLAMALFSLMFGLAVFYKKQDEFILYV